MLKIHEITSPTHQRIVQGIDEERGLDALIAVHSTKLGPALGGCRCWHYPDFSSHLRDAMRLGQAMTMKNSLAGLVAGGGKGVINCNPENKTPELFQAYGELVNFLEGQYLTGEDVGVKPSDVDEMKKTTKFISSNSIPSNLLDPGPATAYGVVRGMEMAARFRLDRVTGDRPPHPNNVLTDLTIVIQGLGNVGFALMEMLNCKGANLIVTDTNSNLVTQAKTQFPHIQTVEPDEIFDVECDIFAPCALGAVLNPSTIERLSNSTYIICGSANNQLETEDCDQLLHDKELLYCPDYLVNAGGVILIYKEESQVTTDFHVSNFIDMIGDRLEECLKTAKRENQSTGKIAEQMAMRRLN